MAQLWADPNPTSSHIPPQHRLPHLTNNNIVSHSTHDHLRKSPRSRSRGGRYGSVDGEDRYGAGAGVGAGAADDDEDDQAPDSIEVESEEGEGIISERDAVLNPPTPGPSLNLAPTSISKPKTSTPKKHRHTRQDGNDADGGSIKGRLAGSKKSSTSSSGSGSDSGSGGERAGGGLTSGYGETSGLGMGPSPYKQKARSQQRRRRHSSEEGLDQGGVNIGNGDGEEEEGLARREEGEMSGHDSAPGQGQGLGDRISNYLFPGRDNVEGASTSDGPQSVGRARGRRRQGSDNGEGSSGSEEFGNGIKGKRMAPKRTSSRSESNSNSNSRPSQPAPPTLSITTSNLLPLPISSSSSHSRATHFSPNSNTINLNTPLSPPNNLNVPVTATNAHNGSFVDSPSGSLRSASVGSSVTSEGSLREAERDLEEGKKIKNVGAGEGSEIRDTSDTGFYTGTGGSGAHTDSERSVIDSTVKAASSRATSRADHNGSPHATKLKRGSGHERESHSRPRSPTTTTHTHAPTRAVGIGPALAAATRLRDVMQDGGAGGPLPDDLSRRSLSGPGGKRQSYKGLERREGLESGSGTPSRADTGVRRVSEPFWAGENGLISPVKLGGGRNGMAKGVVSDLQREEARNGAAGVSRRSSDGSLSRERKDSAEGSGHVVHFQEGGVRPRSMPRVMSDHDLAAGLLQSEKKPGSRALGSRSASIGVFPAQEAGPVGSSAQHAERQQVASSAVPSSPTTSQNASRTGSKRSGKSSRLSRQPIPHPNASGTGESETEREAKPKNSRVEVKRSPVSGKKGAKKQKEEEGEEFGIEGILHGHGAQRARNNDPLQDLLASVDITNALRLISQQTLAPGGVSRTMAMPDRAPNPLAGGRPTAIPASIRVGQGSQASASPVPSSRRGGSVGGEDGSMYIARAPPALLATPDPAVPTTASRDKMHVEWGKSSPKNHKGKAAEEQSPTRQQPNVLKKAPTQPKLKTRNRRGTMIEREVLQSRSGDPALLSEPETAISPVHTTGDESSSELSDGGISDRYGTTRRRHDAPQVGSVDGHHLVAVRSIASDQVSTHTSLQSEGSVRRDAGRHNDPDTVDHGHLVVQKPARRKISDIFSNKHRRSVSAASTLSREETRGRDRKIQEKQRRLREEADKEDARFQQQIQTNLLQMPSHPRSEAIAYATRAHLQAYYGLLIRSIDEHERHNRAGPQWNPLKVIRWRRQVLAEEGRRQSWDKNVTSQAKAYGRLLEAQNGSDDKDASSTPQRNRMDGKPSPEGLDIQSLSAPLPSAIALSRALAADPQAAFASRKSATVKEWMVLPSETIAFLDCNGNVDHFVPPADSGHSVLRDTMAAISGQGDRRRSIVIGNHKLGSPMPDNSHSPASFEGPHSYDSNMSLSSEAIDSSRSNGNIAKSYGSEDGRRSRASIGRRLWHGHRHDQHAHSNDSRESLDRGEKIVAVLKSPLEAIKRHVLHDGRESPDTDDQMVDMPDRRTHLHSLSHNSSIGTDRVKAIDTIYLDSPTPADQSSSNAASETSGAAPDAVGEAQSGPTSTFAKQQDKPATTHVEEVESENELVDIAVKPAKGIPPELDEVYSNFDSLLGNISGQLEKISNDIPQMSSGFDQAYSILQQGIVYIDAAAGLSTSCGAIDPSVLSRGRANTTGSHGDSFRRRPPRRMTTMLPDAGLMPSLTKVAPRQMLDIGDERLADPLSSLELAITTLSVAFDSALPQAIELAQEQDNLQDEVSMLTTQADRLRIRIDAEGNGKIRRSTAQLRSMRMPTERSVDNWFYSLVKYLVNGVLAILRILVYVARLITFIWRIIRAVFIWPYRLVAQGVAYCSTGVKWILSGWVVRTLLILAVWTVILLTVVAK